MALAVIHHLSLTNNIPLEQTALYFAERSPELVASRLHPRLLLDEQLEVASIYFDRELESRIKKFTTMFEPIMIVFVGVIVGFVAMALVSAMYGVLGNTKDQI